MAFAGVVVEAEVFGQRVGLGERGDVLGDAELPGPKALQDIAHKRGGVPPVELLVVFIRTRWATPRRRRSATEED